MSDLISRQDAIDGANEIIKRDTSGNNAVVEAMKAWKAYIGNLPSATDVVEVIRCKYCKHYDMFPNESNGTCQKNVDSRVSFYPWSFCSYGERRENDKE